MKKTDIAMIILIAAGCVLIAFFVTQSILGNPEDEAVKVKTIERITSDVEAPDPKVFNSNAINPTVEVQIDATNQ
jgi:hypothetical protein